MEIIENIAWVYYVNEKEEPKLDDAKVGKWMYFFNNEDFAAEMCRQAVESGIVAEAKHSNNSEGVCCFYLNCDDIAAHRRTLQFFMENELIRKTKKGKLFNISFKLDTQTRNHEYGAEYESNIKLANFVNLETGEWIGEK